MDKTADVEASKDETEVITNDEATEEVANSGPELDTPKHTVKYCTSVFPRLMTPSHQNISISFFFLFFPLVFLFLWFVDC